MKKILLAGLATGMMLLGVSGIANADNIALGKSVTLNGTYGTGGWSTATASALAASLTDGIAFLPDNSHEWDKDTVWWNGYSYPANNIIVDLGADFAIDSFYVQADDNDTYRLEYSVNGGAWINAWDIPTAGSWGMVGRSTSLGTPIIADSLRFTNISGDGYYSVSEIQAFGSAVAPVPEPATMLLMATGLSGLIAARRKKKA